MEHEATCFLCSWLKQKDCHRATVIHFNLKLVMQPRNDVRKKGTYEKMATLCIFGYRYCFRIKKITIKIWRYLVK